MLLACHWCCFKITIRFIVLSSAFDLKSVHRTFRYYNEIEGDTLRTLCTYYPTKCHLIMSAYASVIDLLYCMLWEKNSSLAFNLHSISYRFIDVELVLICIKTVSMFFHNIHYLIAYCHSALDEEIM